MLRTSSAVRLVFGRAFRRSYATRRPVKPPQKTEDPLLSAADAVVAKLPGDLTLIHRPPPTAPTAHSTTLAPASPLLKTPSSKKTTNNSDRPTESSSELPPLLHVPRGHTFPAVTLTEADYAEMRRLRELDPFKYSRNLLARMFKCSPWLVAQQCPLSMSTKKEALRRREEEHRNSRESWGERKTLVMALRKKRKEFW